MVYRVQEVPSAGFGLLKAFLGHTPPQESVWYSLQKDILCMGHEKPSESAQSYESTGSQLS